MVVKLKPRGPIKGSIHLEKSMSLGSMTWVQILASLLVTLAHFYLVSSLDIVYKYLAKSLLGQGKVIVFIKPQQHA